MRKRATMQKHITTGWIIIDGTGNILPDTFAVKQKEAVDKIVGKTNDRAKTWRNLYRKYGYRLQRAVVKLEV